MVAGRGIWDEKSMPNKISLNFMKNKVEKHLVKSAEKSKKSDNKSPSNLKREKSHESLDLNEYLDNVRN